jgi:hypothetical protein
MYRYLKVFVKLKKNPKNPLVWAKNPKKTQKTQKTQKNPKKTTGLGLKKKNPGFFQPWKEVPHMFAQYSLVGVASGPKV